MLAACIISIVVGGALLARGLVGRRVGDEPRCRRCGYIVHGIESGQCPECGLALGPGAVRAGERVRRWRALAIGCLLLLIGAAFGVAVGTGWAARTNFYQYLPTGWVVQAAGRGSADAMAIVEARVNADEVKGSRMRELIEAGLASQGAERMDANTQRWIDLLAQIEKHVGMTEEQREQFYSQMVKLRVSVRPKERKGNWLPLELLREFRVPTSKTYAWIGRVSVALPDGTQLSDERIASDLVMTDRTFLPRDYYVDSEPECMLDTSELRPGKYVAEVRISAALSHAQFGRPLFDDTLEPVWKGQRTLAAQFEVLSRDAAPPVSTLSDSETIAKVRDSLEFRAKVARYSNKWGMMVVECRIARPSPCDAWIDVSLPWEPLSLIDLISTRPRVYIRQGVEEGSFRTLGRVRQTALGAGDTLVLKLRSAKKPKTYGAGTQRLKGGIEFEPVRVTVEDWPGLPTSRPVVGAGAGGGGS